MIKLEFRPIRKIKRMRIEIIDFIRRIRGSSSQYGEDIILADMLRCKKNGFYIDVGANNPKTFSNTEYFYKRGFRGVNIEANPNLIEKFFEQRPEDVNLNIGIATQIGEMDFYVLSCPFLGTFSKDVAIRFCKERNVEIKNTIKVKTMPLKIIMEKYVGDKTIDFISIDAEGYDLDVLKSADWKKYRPEFFILETSEDYDNLIQFMSKNNYKIVYENGTNTIFKDALN